MRLYRFVTPVFYGNWHSTRRAAEDDAIRAGQAKRDRRGEVSLLGDCRIEETDRQS